MLLELITAIIYCFTLKVICFSDCCCIILQHVWNNNN